MPDAQVLVSFTAPDSFVFTPDTVTVLEPEHILFVRDPAQSAWSFVRFEVPLGDPSDFEQDATAGSTMRVLDRKHRSGTFSYTITIRTESGQEIDSDPKVVNVPEFPDSGRGRGGNGASPGPVLRFLQSLWARMSSFRS
jgi:hypothetical protein